MNSLATNKIDSLYEASRLALARAILPALSTEDDQELAHAFMKSLDMSIEYPSVREGMQAIAGLPQEAISSYIEAYPIAIVAYTRQSVEARIGDCADDDERESLKRFLVFLKKVGAALAKTLH